MHAHFLVARLMAWCLWLGMCCTGAMLRSSETQTNKQTNRDTNTVQANKPSPVNRQALPQRGAAVFAGGCFWCTESDLEKVPGVIEVIPGYSGGRTRNPTYETYASGGHREVVFVVYDSSQITYAGLVEYLIKHIDPTNRVGQFQDRGRQYGPAIYYDSEAEKLEAQRVVAAIERMKVFRREVNVSIEPRQAFWPAEEYHQNYHVKNLRKYQFYRAASGRDAFLQQHWGHRSEQLELDGAYPSQSSDSRLDHSSPGSIPHSISDSRIGMATADDSATAAGPEKGTYAADGSASGAVGEPSASPQEAASPHGTQPAWLDFHKPSPQALRQQLTTMQYRVTQHDETEPAYQNRYWNNHRPGIYVDLVSGEPLFSSDDKFDSGTGWPSFVAPIDAQAVRYTQDNKLSYARIEVRSTHGDSHLGHLFYDGPVQRGGKRYCLNSAALRFVPREAMQSEGYADYLPLVQE